MNDGDAGDSELLDRIPFERGEPPAGLWSRIENGAKTSQRSYVRRSWIARAAAMVAGALGWLAFDAVVRSGPNTQVAEPHSAHDAWLAETPAELPPEALLATLLVSQGEGR